LFAFAQTLPGYGDTQHGRPERIRAIDPLASDAMKLSPAQHLSRRIVLEQSNALGVFEFSADRQLELGERTL